MKAEGPGRVEFRLDFSRPLASVLFLSLLLSRQQTAVRSILEWEAAPGQTLGSAASVHKTGQEQPPTLSEVALGTAAPGVLPAAWTQVCGIRREQDPIEM